MSVEAVLLRMAEIHTMVSRPRQAAATTATATNAMGTLTPTGATAGTAGTSFASALAGAGTPAQRLVTAAQGEVGQAEQPPGSNDSPRIAQYRAAMPGNPGVGPWCAYFVSWAAREAGTPLGDRGEGFASVDALASWGQRSGRWNAASSGVPPQPGDLIVWDEHVGLVESVDPDGTVRTIEGNSSDQVIRRTHAAGSALGYVRP
ncbi:CHAP domain-containing protein [Conexibacter sp. SYSU D00693]|uniref:CHAP domain-containing protein n=1 Tax=Conexibacter sp. SYSU D00693 TaxID=2812560 RepID=UPI00196B614D|nr:CHAP domain-containing protein [Conexibacter sp. SYSU D00693]